MNRHRFHNTAGMAPSRHRPGRVSDRDQSHFRSLDRKVLQTEIPAYRDFSLKYLSIQRSEMRLISIRYPPRSMPRRIYHARSESEAVPVHESEVYPQFYPTESEAVPVHRVMAIDFFFSGKGCEPKRKNLASPDEPAPTFASERAWRRGGISIDHRIFDR